MYLGVRAQANAAGVAVMESPLWMLWQEREAVKEKKSAAAFRRPSKKATSDS